MPERYIDAILKYLASRDYRPLKPRQLARNLGVQDEEYGSFRDALKQLRDSGRVILGAKDCLTLPGITSTITGFYRANPRGFGFIIPQTPNAHGDLFIPPGAQAGAMTGDLVTARVVPRGKRDGREMFAGQIVEILQRGQNRFVGTLDRSPEGTWFVTPDGATAVSPIVVPDVGAAGPGKGAKVVVEILVYGQAGKLPSGVLVETLGASGEIDVETNGVIRAHGLKDQFSPESLADVRAAVKAFDPERLDGRTDLTGQTIITIDPPDARDYDDAISLTELRDGTSRLGVHIADVAHFIPEGSSLDTEARERGTSVYFPRRVVPMLPELLSNGICSLQEGQRRYCKTAWITYDAKGHVLKTEFANTVISSAKRLTYVQAQDIIDGKVVAGATPAVIDLLGRMDRLARLIEARRRKAGMLHLDLPEVRLVFSEAGKVLDAVPEDTSYTHTIIEMLMVEANDAVAELMSRLNRPILRRIHPDPDQQGAKQLSTFIRACGCKVPVNMSCRDIQALLASVKGRPESYAVNLAVLRTFEQAEYSPMNVGHFALASKHYCHFTSPIRRYPDLTVHRMLDEYVRGRLKNRPPEDLSALNQLGSHCSAAERRAKAAEDELRQVLVLQLLARQVGQQFDGVITGVTNFGMFVQLRRLLIDGLVRLEDLGDDWWNVDAQRGQVHGQASGRKYRIGDMMQVRVANVNVPRRQLDLAPARETTPRKQPPRPAAKKDKTGKDKGSQGNRRGKRRRSR